MTKEVTELAFEVISKKKKPVPFGKLWEEVSKRLGLVGDDIGYFYQELDQDDRFVSVENNEWTLKDRVKNLKMTETDLSLLSIEELIKMCEDYGLDYEEGQDQDYYIDLINSVDDEDDDKSSCLTEDTFIKDLLEDPDGIYGGPFNWDKGNPKNEGEKNNEE